LSSEEGFFDVIFLGIFVILSPAFDGRFYDSKVPSQLVAEAAFAVNCFHDILLIFSERFHIFVGGEPVVHLYVFNRMLGEFAAAAVVFAKACREKAPADYDEGHGEFGVTYKMFRARVEAILLASYSNIFPYYSRCVDRAHKHFLWTGAKVGIYLSSESCDALVVNRVGEHRDLPSHEIYTSPQDPTPPTLPTLNPPAVKRHDRDDGVDDADEQRKKRRT
jgi:hypothetical protein